MLPSIQSISFSDTSSKARKNVQTARPIRKSQTPADSQIHRLQLSSAQPHEQPLCTRHQPHEEKVLDGFSLLESIDIALPDDAIFGILSGKNFTRVAEGDFPFFTELLFLDVSENFLNVGYFGNLPKLEELRLVCNGIREIRSEELLGFGKFLSLKFLDLSYNSLSPGSISSLGCLKHLKELNLCGNFLTSLPTQMESFNVLEKLLLENNKFESADIFHSIADLPNLREVSLAYNFLANIPSDLCSVSKFRVLETLDLAYNYFIAESDVLSVLSLSRLRVLLLYGNPLLGPTGEDPHFLYIEDLANSALDAREGPGMHPIELITEKPRKRVFRKGADVGRRLMTYRDFHMTVTKRSELDKLGDRTRKEWIETGNATLFAEAMAIAYSQQNIENSRIEKGTNRDRDLECTFLTRAEDFGEEEEKEEIEEISMERGREEEGEKRARETKQKHRGQQRQQAARRRSAPSHQNADSYTIRTFNSESQSQSEGHSAANNKIDSRGDGGSVRDRAESKILGLGLGRDEEGRKGERERVAARGGPSISDLSALRDRVIEAKAKSAATGAERGTRQGGREKDRERLEKVADEDDGDEAGRRGARGFLSNSSASTARGAERAKATGTGTWMPSTGDKKSCGNRVEEGGRRGEGSDTRERERDRAEMPSMAMGSVLGLGRSLTEALPLTSHPIALRTAISALRFAIRNPLTNHYEVPSNPASQGLSHNSSTASSITRKSESKTHFTTREEARNKEREKDTGEREKERDNRGSNAGCLSSALLGPNSAQDVYSRNHQHQADSSAHADADADAGTTQRISGGGSSRGQDRNCSDRRGVTQRGRNNSATNRLRYLDSILDTLNSTNTDRDRDRAALSRSLPIALPQALIGDRLITQGGRDRGTNSHNRPSSSSTARRGTSTRSGINNLILMVDEVVSKLS